MATNKPMAHLDHGSTRSVVVGTHFEKDHCKTQLLVAWFKGRNLTIVQVLARVRGVPRVNSGVLSITTRLVKTWSLRSVSLAGVLEKRMSRC